jgi:hypothetical protein
MRNIYDQTLFAWSLSSASIEDVIAQERAHQGAVPEDKLTDPSPFGMFAPHPKAFKGCQNIVYVYGDMPHIGTYVKEKNGSTRATLPIVTLKEDSGMQELVIGLLPCSATDKPNYMVGVLLRPWVGLRSERVSLRSGSSTVFVECKTALAATVQKVWIHDQTYMDRISSNSVHLHRTILINGSSTPSEDFRFVACKPHLETDSTATTFYVPNVEPYSIVYLNFASVPNVPKDPSFRFTVCLGLGWPLPSRSEGSKPENDHVCLYEYPIPEYTENLLKRDVGFRAWGRKSKAELYVHGARVLVAVASRLIFHQLITDVTITVKWSSRSLSYHSSSTYQPGSARLTTTERSYGA